jgi:phage shock protein PspC (stress-responsive transcriptional regulator)
MKTTITINLGGIVFHIDDDAYEMLHTYLIAIEKQFASKEEHLEVMPDIEARLSELFTETLNKKRDVIMKDDVSKVIEIMGEPEEFRDDESEDNFNNSGKESKRRSSYNRTSKKLFRDPDNRILGGICSGLGAYFNVDPIVFRIIFILIALGMGSGVIIYVILWIVIPEAMTTAQKLEMRGEPITIENIKKAVREEFDNVKKKMKF